MSNTIWLLILCIPALLAVFWVHYRLRTHQSGTRWTTGGILLGIGLLFGWVMAFIYTPSQGTTQLLVFLSSFGLVHVPAAFILQLKHWQRRESETD